MADADEHPTITYLSEQDYSTGPIPHLVERTCCVDFLVAEPREVPVPARTAEDTCPMRVPVPQMNLDGATLRTGSHGSLP